MDRARGHRPCLRARASLMAAASLSVLLLATAAPVSADPARPINNLGLRAGPGDVGRPVALGLATPDGRSPQVLDELTDAVGRRPAIWAIWSQWGHNGMRAFPRPMADALKARGIVPFIWWEPVNPGNLSDPTYPRHRNIIEGDHDAYIRQFARDARDFGAPVLLRFAHEMNNHYFPWSIHGFDNSPASFVSAWRHVHDIFRAEGASNVRFVWSVNKQTCPGGCNPYHAVYPGDAYVDVMGFSGYNWGATEGKAWKSMLESYRMVTRKLGEVADKPIIVSETASNSVGGDKAAWISEGYREVYRELPEIAAIVWLNADLRDIGHPDWRITSPSGALAAYADIAALPQFDVRAAVTVARERDGRVGVSARRGDRDAKRPRTAAATRKERDDIGKRRPARVRAGASGGPEPGDEGATARKARNTTTKGGRRKAPDSEPPEVLDTFGR